MPILRPLKSQQAQSLVVPCVRLIHLICFPHHQHGESGPAGEGTAALAFARLIVVLLPNVPSPFILFNHITDHGSPEFVVHTLRLFAVRALRVGVVAESTDSQKVDVDPDGAPPVRRIMLRVSRHVEGR